MNKRIFFSQLGTVTISFHIIMQSSQLDMLSLLYHYLRKHKKHYIQRQNT